MLGILLTQVGDAALSILHSMVSAHSDLDDAGEIVTPTPRVKRILSSARCLPHIAQVYDSGNVWPPLGMSFWLRM